jgi:predicted dehydrogenase
MRGRAAAPGAMARGLRLLSAMHEPEDRSVRYAVIGLGHIAQVAVLPAFAHAKGSTLVAIVSGDDQKREELGRRYSVPHAVHYDEYDRLLESGEVDAVYIAVPNHLHRDYAVRAAERGIHVLCEKPLAVTEEECERMIGAAAESGVKLMNAKRLHFESATLEAIEVARSGELGELRAFESVFSQRVKPGDIRLAPIARGGGAVYDIGVYCIDAARQLFADEPTEVIAASARGADPRFRECDEMTSAILRFPGERLASFTCSFGSARVAQYRLLGTRGMLTMENAYEYSQPMAYEVEVEGEVVRRREFPVRDQFAPQLTYFSRCALEDLEPEPDGYDGLADVTLVRAVYRAAETGSAIEVEPVPQRSRPDRSLEQVFPAVEPPEEIRASGPSE